MTGMAYNSMGTPGLVRHYLPEYGILDATLTTAFILPLIVLTSSGKSVGP